MWQLVNHLFGEADKSNNDKNKVKEKKMFCWINYISTKLLLQTRKNNILVQKATCASQ